RTDTPACTERRAAGSRATTLVTTSRANTAPGARGEASRAASRQAVAARTRQARAATSAAVLPLVRRRRRRQDLAHRRHAEPAPLRYRGPLDARRGGSLYLPRRARRSRAAHVRGVSRRHR